MARLAWNRSGFVRSLSPSIAAFLAAEIELAVLPVARVRLPALPGGIVYDRDRGQAVSPDRIVAPNSLVRSMDAQAVTRRRSRSLVSNLPYLELYSERHPSGSPRHPVF